MLNNRETYKNLRLYKRSSIYCLGKISVFYIDSNGDCEVSGLSSSDYVRYNTKSLIPLTVIDIVVNMDRINKLLEYVKSKGGL